MDKLKLGSHPSVRRKEPPGGFQVALAASGHGLSEGPPFTLEPARPKIVAPHLRNNQRRLPLSVTLHINLVSLRPSFPLRLL